MIEAVAGKALMNKHETHDTALRGVLSTKSLLFALLAFALTMGCTSPKSDPRIRQELASQTTANAPWYLAKFSGRMEGNAFSVECKTTESCDLEFSDSRYPIAFKSKPHLRDGAFLSRFLTEPRAALKDRPAFYTDATWGEAMRSVKAVVESDARFDECIALTDQKFTDGKPDEARQPHLALCRVNRPMNPQFVFLTITMLGACSGSPFCTYAFHGVQRGLHKH